MIRWLVIGGLLSLGLTRLLRNMLFGVGPGDPVAFLSAAALMTLVTVIASDLPARRATRIQPTVALRSD